jgi:uncharacterized membrane protein
MAGSNDMKAYIISYIATGIVFLGCDFVWLSQMGNTLYRAQLGGMLLENFAPAPAIVFYLIYIVGIVTLAVAPALASGHWFTALGYGALFGFCAYATYDLTNQATLKGWSVVVTLADLGWGTVVTGLAATLGYAITQAVMRMLGETI